MYSKQCCSDKPELVNKSNLKMCVFSRINTNTHTHTIMANVHTDQSLHHKYINLQTLHSSLCGNQRLDLAYFTLHSKNTNKFTRPTATGATMRDMW